jgi:DNA-directed RNA polymerase subunit RPC12/RpoP
LKTRFKDDFGDRQRRKERSRSARSNRTPYLGVDPRNGVAIQCQYCSGQTFRRSTLRAEDLTDILLMRYPIRCLRCSQRQLVSFTIASLAVSSSVKPTRKKHASTLPNHWTDFTKHTSSSEPSSPD